MFVGIATERLPRGEEYPDALFHVLVSEQLHSDIVLSGIAKHAHHRVYPKLSSSPSVELGTCFARKRWTEVWPFGSRYNRSEYRAGLAFENASYWCLLIYLGGMRRTHSRATMVYQRMPLSSNGSPCRASWKPVSLCIRRTNCLMMPTAFISRLYF